MKFLTNLEVAQLQVAQAVAEVKVAARVVVRVAANPALQHHAKSEQFSVILKMRTTRHQRQRFDVKSQIQTTRRTR